MTVPPRIGCPTCDGAKPHRGGTPKSAECPLAYEAWKKYMRDYLRNRHASDPEFARKRRAQVKTYKKMKMSTDPVYKRRKRLADQERRKRKRANDPTYRATHNLKSRMRKRRLYDGKDQAIIDQILRDHPELQEVVSGLTS